MYEKRIRVLALAFGCLGILLFSGICYRMILQGEEITSTPFIQQNELGRIHTLARQGVISRGDEGEVRIDYQALRTRFGNSFTGFVKKREKFLSYTDNGQLVINRDGLKVTNRRVIQASTLARRGTITDRKGRLLAQTLKNETGSLYRSYPYGASMLPVVGAIHPVFGARGLEKQLAPWLTGRKSAGGAASLYRFLSGREKNGDVHLTVDAEVQKAAYKALGDRTGAIVVLDVQTGAIVAAASTPSFDPGKADRTTWEKAASLGFQGPFTNRGLQRRYPPGSTFKIINATAVIDKKGFNPKSGLTCRGWLPEYGIHDSHHKKHGWVGLRNAFKLSCNVYFAEAGVRLGPELLQKAELFGFNRSWNLIGRGEKPTTVQSLAFAGKKTIQGGGRWQPADFQHNPKLVAQGGIGQNVVVATPLQMALAGAAIANDGSLMQPFLVDRVTFAANRDKGEGLIDWWHNRPQEFSRVCRKKNAEKILNMMELVMDKGTGFRLPKLYRSKGKYKLFVMTRKGGRQKNLLAGKTGTAQTGRGEHSWFVAVAPVDHPRYAVAAIVEYAGAGAKAAGRVAVKTMLAALNSEE